MPVNPSSLERNFGKGRSGQRRRNLRARLFKEQEGKCHWCHKAMELEYFKNTVFGNLKHNPMFATFEHLLPMYRGGINGTVNLVLAHAHCNYHRKSRKWAHDPVYGQDASKLTMKAAPR